MRGPQEKQDDLFSYVSMEDRIPEDHPLRRIKILLEVLLRDLSRELDGLYADIGRRSIPPEYLLKASLLQMLYSIRSERLLVEEINYNLLFRWFIGLKMDDAVWDHSTFTKNRDRLLDGDIARKLLEHVLGLAREHHLLSDDHFTVDGTLVEAWASQKSFQKRTEATGSSSDSDDPGNPRSTSVERNGRTIRTSLRRILKPCSIVKDQARKPSCHLWDMRSSTTATASLSRQRLHKPPARQNARLVCQ